MATGKTKRPFGLRLHSERKDSESYLLSPELSGSPTQFSLSSSFSLGGDSNPGHRNTYVSIQSTPSPDSTLRSIAPLLPQSRPCRGQRLRGECSRVQSNFIYGVGDLEHIHVDCSQPKTYDYADYGHQYEELPNRKSIAKSPQDSGIDSRSEMYQSSSGTTDRSVSETGDTSNICNSHLSEKRKRVNPLYDAMTQSMPSIYNKTKSDQITETLKKHVRWLKCALIVFVVISCAALAVSIFAVINNIQTKDDRHPVLSPEVERLSASQERLELLLSSFEDNNDTMKVLSDLVQKVNRIQGNLTAELAGLNGRHENQTMEIQKNVEQAMADFNNLTDVISHLNSTLQLQLHSISKMEGPQGPQGVANFSQCKYYNHTRSSVPSDSIPTYTPWFPTVTSLESNIALFAACSVEGGLYHSIQTHALSPQTVQYKCKCSGVSVPKVEQRHCIIHILECPRFS